MRIHLLLLLLTVLILGVISGLSYNTYSRLKKASNQYETDDAFEDASHLSITYVKGGKILSGILIFVSLVMMAISCYLIKKSK